MRVLTKLEKKQFEKAYDYVSRIGAMAYENCTMFDIKMHHEGENRNLPSKVVSLLGSFKNLKEVNAWFNGHAKEKKFGFIY